MKNSVFSLILLALTATSARASPCMSGASIEQVLRGTDLVARVEITDASAMRNASINSAALFDVTFAVTEIIAPVGYPIDVTTQQHLAVRYQTWSIYKEGPFLLFLKKAPNGTWGEAVSACQSLPITDEDQVQGLLHHVAGLFSESERQPYDSKDQMRSISMDYSRTKKRLVEKWAELR